jgi:adenylate cyclase
MSRRLRLLSGLVLFAFITTHFLNHALGVVSLGAAEAGRAWFLGFWRNPVGTALLYGSLVVHVALVLWALYQRRHLRLPRWEIVRLALGLAMPLLLLPHIFGTRVLHEVFGVEDTYAHVVLGMWVLHPSSSLVQSALLLIAWVHGCMGIHYWLKVKPWYPTALPILRALSLLVPAVSLLGFADTGQELAALAGNSAWLETEMVGIHEAEEAPVLLWANVATAGFVALVALVFVGRRLRDLWERRKGVVRLTYPDGRRVAVTPGTTILEASRAAGIPHASLCGGRGRCSTCRSRIGTGLQSLAKPAPEEERVLRRVGAPPNVRLACQLRPTVDLEVFPLLPSTATPADGFLRPSYTQGREQEIAILFADLRSFTHFAEHRLPYDVVFVLNQYFATMGEAVGRAGGHLDKFIGDGVMALFGLDRGPAQGCRDALAGALAMARGLEELNRALANDLTEPLRIGVGIHAGPVIVGEMGHGRATSLTAIGDAVNTASRLESMNKEYKSQLIVSEEVATRAGLDLSSFPSYEIEVRGRTTAMTIHVVANATDLEPLLAAPQSAPPLTPTPVSERGAAAG